KGFSTDQESLTLGLAYLQVKKKKLPVLVDRFLGEGEVILKKMDPYLSSFSLVTGGSLLEDGSLAYLLNFSLLDSSKVTFTVFSPSSISEKTTSKIILVVDDSPITREMEKNILEMAGYQVLEGENGKKGLEILKSHTPHLVITDIEMPEMDGLAFTREIRKNPKWKDLPVIVVSTRGSPEDIQGGLQAGANGYMIKGDFTSTKFLETVQEWLSLGNE
ncbi:MAG: hybrid sensor histidine kinase/response regulator, partial [Planctomycetota bacterium]